MTRSSMKITLLAAEEVQAGYEALSQLYPNIPPIIVWRGWEYAAYQRFSLVEPVLDVGCGDGRYFRFIWPSIREVTGVDMNPLIVEAARKSGVYRDVLVSAAHEFHVPSGSFGSAFANCSLEHMDELDEVLNGVCRSLAPGGPFLLSVITDKFIEWASLPLILEKIGSPSSAKTLLDSYIQYHHAVNPLSPTTWVEKLESAGFEVLEHLPIVPEITGRLFLVLDQLWHLPTVEGELGQELFSRCASMPDFHQGLLQVLMGVLKMDQDWSSACGAVFYARKKADTQRSTG
jgi:SAM-dependent methyltransferase